LVLLDSFTASWTCDFFAPVWSPVRRVLGIPFPFLAALCGSSSAVSFHSKSFFFSKKASLALLDLLFFSSPDFFFWGVVFPPTRTDIPPFSPPHISDEACLPSPPLGSLSKLFGVAFQTVAAFSIDQSVFPSCRVRPLRRAPCSFGPAGVLFNPFLFSALAASFS